MTSVRDILLISVILFAVGICIMFAVDIGHRVNTNLLTIDTFNNSAAATNIINSADAALDKTDYLFLALFIGFFFSIIIFGWYVGGETILAPIYFFIIVIFAFVGVILQLAWSDIGANSSVIAATANLPITNFILLHLGYFTVAMGLAGLIAMYAKPVDNGVY